MTVQYDSLIIPFGQAKTQNDGPKPYYFSVSSFFQNPEKQSGITMDQALQ